MKKIIDISVPIDGNSITWPGNKKPKIKRLSDMKKGKMHNETLLEMNAHAGTHIDAPLHFVAKGKPIDTIPLEIFYGAVYVADVGRVKEITEKELEKIKLPKGIQKILFKTSNSKLWSTNRKFTKHYVGITPDAARWLVRKKIQLVGIDYLSVAKYDDAVQVHNILLEKGVAILEGTNLSGVRGGAYELLCFPLKIRNGEAAPTRAVLIA